MRENQGGLGAAAGQQGDGFVEADELLGEHLDEGEIAVGKEFDDEFGAAAAGLFRGRSQQVRGLQFGYFFEQAVLGFLRGFDFVERLASLLRDFPD